MHSMPRLARERQHCFVVYERQTLDAIHMLKEREEEEQEDALKRQQPERIQYHTTTGVDAHMQCFHNARYYIFQSTRKQ